MSFADSTKFTKEFGMKKKAEKVKQSEELKDPARDRVYRDPLDVSGHHG